MTEYERLTVDEEGSDGMHAAAFRQRTLMRWRFSMLLSFIVGGLVVAAGYPKVMGCSPDIDELVAKAVARAQGGGSNADGEIAARHRASMLARPMRNIVECSADAKDDSCRMGSSNRFKVLGQKGVTLWMTGLSGAGKTTITKALEKRLLLAMRKNVYNVDGDNLRTGLTRDLGFSASDRAESVRRASEVAQLFSEAGVITVVSLISPYRKDRDAARLAHEKRGIPFLEVFLDVPLNVVKARDPKGLYAKVAKGMIKNFTGIDSPYEAPLKPEITLKTHELAVEKCVDALVAQLRNKGYLIGDPVSDGLHVAD